MINSIAIILIISVVFIAFNTFSVFYLKNKMEHIRSMVKEINNDLESKMFRVKSDTQPLVNKYKEEQRQKHWEQYNHWKYGMDRLEIENCFKCSSDNLSTLVFYDNDYPVKADFHCEDCCYRLNKWEFKEDSDQ